MPDAKLDRKTILATMKGAQRLHLLCIEFDERWGIRAGLLVLDCVPPDYAIKADDEGWTKALEFTKTKGHDIVTKDRVVFAP
jgi:hypothetical protein